MEDKILDGLNEKLFDIETIFKNEEEFFKILDEVDQILKEHGLYFNLTDLEKEDFELPEEEEEAYSLIFPLYTQSGDLSEYDLKVLFYKIGDDEYEADIGVSPSWEDYDSEEEDDGE